MYTYRVVGRSQSNITDSNRPAFPWVAVFVILALVLPLTLCGILGVIFPDFRRYWPKWVHFRRNTKRRHTKTKSCHEQDKPLDIVRTRTRKTDLAPSVTYSDHVFSCQPTFSLWSWWKTHRVRSTASSRSTNFDDLAERGYNAWDLEIRSADTAYMSGALVNDKSHTHGTARRRRQSKGRSSSFFQSIARAAVSKLLLPDGANRKFSRSGNAVSDLEAAFPTPSRSAKTSRATSSETTIERPRGVSMPIMPLTSPKSIDDDLNLYSGSLASHRSVSTHGGPEKVCLAAANTSSLLSSYYLPEPVTTGYNYPALSMDGCIEADGDQRPVSQVHCYAKRSYSWSSSRSSHLDVSSTKDNTYDGVELQTLHDYEAEGSIDSALSSRLPSDATSSFFHAEHRKIYDAPLPDYSMTGYYNAPIHIPKFAQHATPFATARTHIPYGYPQTPNGRFPLRRLQHRHSDSSLTEPPIPHYARIFDANDYLREPPKSTGRRWKLRRSQKMSPVPKTFLDGANDSRDGGDELDVPRKRPLSQQKEAGSSTPDHHDARKFTIDDLPSASTPKGMLTRNPFAVRDKARREPGSAGTPAARTTDQGSPMPRPTRAPTYTRNINNNQTPSAGSIPRPTRSRSTSPSPYMQSTASPKLDFESQKRRFSGPAERERSLRRLRRVGGKSIHPPKFGLHSHDSLMGQSTAAVELKGGKVEGMVGTMSSIAVGSEEVEMGRNRKVGGTKRGLEGQHGLDGGSKEGEGSRVRDGNGEIWEGNGEDVSAKGKGKGEGGLKRSPTHKREGQKIVASEPEKVQVVEQMGEFVKGLKGELDADGG